MDFIKTHNLDILLSSCADVNIRFREIDVNILEDFAVRGRYPHDFLLPTLPEAEEFYEIALTVKKQVLKEMGFV